MLAEGGEGGVPVDAGHLRVPAEEVPGALDEEGAEERDEDEDDQHLDEGEAVLSDPRLMRAKARPGAAGGAPLRWTIGGASKVRLPHLLVAGDPQPPGAEGALPVVHRELDLVEAHLVVAAAPGQGLAVADRLEELRGPGDVEAVDLDPARLLLARVDGGEVLDGVAGGGDLAGDVVDPDEGDEVGVVEE